MKFLQCSLILGFFALLAHPALATPAALAPYTDNPLVEFLSQQRYHLFLNIQADPSNNDHDTLSFVGGIGYFPLEKLSVGLYGSVRNSDRLYPVRMKQMLGLGLFAEYNLAPYATVQPFGGLRYGFIDSSGRGNPTSTHAALLGGLKFAFNQNTALSVAGVFNWAEDEIFDYKQNKGDGSFTGSQTDFGIEVGIRFGF